MSLSIRTRVILIISAIIAGMITASMIIGISGTDGWSLGVMSPITESPIFQATHTFVISGAVFLGLGIIAALIAASFIAHPFEKMKKFALAAVLAALLTACALPIGEDYIIDIPHTEGIAIPTPINLTSLIPTPVTGATPATSFFAGTYGGTVVWETGGAMDGVFQPSTEYEAVVTLYPATGYVFPDSVQVTHSGAGAVPAAFMRAAGGTVPVTIVFPATGGGETDIVIPTPVDLMNSSIPVPVWGTAR